MSLVIDKQEFKNRSFKPPVQMKKKSKFSLLFSTAYIDPPLTQKQLLHLYQYKFYTGSP